MKKGIFLLFFIFISLSIVVFAQEEQPKYNFGSAQGSKELTIAPNKEGTTKLFFYNIYGNRITHISLSVSEAPENWIVEIDPPLHTTIVKVSGLETDVTENLFVEPSEAVQEVPEDIPEGIEYITSSVGYIGANPVTISIKVPEDEKLGKVSDVVISAKAEWLGQGGSIAFTQSRDFRYIVTVLSEKFTEEIVPEVPEVAQAEEASPSAEVVKEEVSQPQVVEKEVKGGVSTGIFVGVVFILLIIMAAIIIFFIKKKR